MKTFAYRSLTVAALTVLPMAAQMASRAVPPPPSPTIGTPAPKAKIPISTLYSIERTCDDKLNSLGENRSLDLLGATRGVYLEGYGTVFSIEINLVTPPAIYPFHPTISKEEMVRQHDRKLERLPKLRAAMTEMMKAAATSLSAMPDTQQIVLSVRLDNMKWEDTTGLPGMILMKADRRSALLGNIKTEEE
jgi:hypothetical protein